MEEGETVNLYQYGTAMPTVERQQNKLDTYEHTQEPE
jgi:hypothetical protein